MIARKQYRAAASCTLVVVWLAGCEAPQGPKRVPGPGPTRVSAIPSWGAEQGAEITSPEILPTTHLAAGRLHESQGRLARAAEQYRLAIGPDPSNVEAHNRLGIVLDRLGRFQEADEAFTRAITLAPEQAHLRNNLAFSYVIQGRWADAEVELVRALEMHPEFARARVNLGMVYAQQERFDEAMTQFQMALPREDAHYNMGLMYQSKRYPVEAALEFQSALELNPKMVAAKKRLALLPPEVLSAARATAANVAVTASPAPMEGDFDQAVDEGTRPTTRPAEEELAREEPPTAPAVPENLCLSIETSRDDGEGESDDSFLWMPLRPQWSPTELVGPPFEQEDEPAKVSRCGDHEPAPSRWRDRLVNALVRSTVEPARRLFDLLPSSVPAAALRMSSPRSPSVGDAVQTAQRPTDPTVSPAPTP